MLCLRRSALENCLDDTPEQLPQTGVQFIHGHGTLNNGGNLTVTFGTSFTSASSYDCNASDATNGPGATGVQNQTANSIKINGTGNHQGSSPNLTERTTPHVVIDSNINNKV